MRKAEVVASLGPKEEEEQVAENTLDGKSDENDEK
jgi:hypothetical protein